MSAQVLASTYDDCNIYGSCEPVSTLVSSGGSTSWNDLTDIPSGFADNIDNTSTGSNPNDYENQTISYNALTDEITLDGGGGTIDITEVDTDTQLSDSDISSFGYIKSYTETESLWSANYTNLNDTWSTDTDTTYTAGSNLSLIGTIFSLDTTAVFNWLSNLFYPLNSNPAGYLTSYTETESLWSANYTNLNDTWSTDTNAETICSNDEVLLGNGTCTIISTSGGSTGTPTYYASLSSIDTTSLSTTDYDVTMDTEIMLDSIYTHSANSPIINITQSGTYIISTTFKTALDGTTRSDGLAWIEIDSGSGYAEIPNQLTRMSNYARETTTTPYSTSSSTFTLELTSPTLIKMVAKEVTGGQKLVRGSSITIVKIGSGGSESVITKNNSVNIAFGQRSITTSKYINQNGVTTTSIFGFVAQHNGSMISASYNVAFTLPFGGNKTWKFTPRINNVNVNELKFEKNFSSGQVNYTTVDYGVVPVVEGDIIVCYAKEIDNGATVTTLNCNFEVAYHD